MAEKLKKYKYKGQDVIGLGAFLTIVLILGINFIFVRIQNREMAPFWGASLRFIIASFFLWLIILRKKLLIPRGKNLVAAVLYGLLAFGANSGLLYLSLKTASPALASVIYSTIPLTTLIISTLTSGRNLNKRSVLAAVLTVAGIFLVFKSDLAKGISGTSFMTILVASIFAALSGIVVKNINKCSPIAINAVGMTSGSIALLTLSVVTKEPMVLPALISTWLALSWLILSSSAAFILMVWTITRWNPYKVSFNSVLSPLITIAVGVLFGRHVASPYFILGSSVVILGVFSALKTVQAEQI